MYINGGDLTVNPRNGFVYEHDGVRIEVSPCVCESQHESFYREVEAVMAALLMNTKPGERE